MYVLPRKVHACAHAQYITIIPDDGLDGSKSISISYAVLTIVLLCQWLLMVRDAIERVINVLDFKLRWDP